MKAAPVDSSGWCNYYLPLWMNTGRETAFELYAWYYFVTH